VPYVTSRQHHLAEAQLNGSPALILVHGTGSTARLNLQASDGARWWQQGSEFDRWLCSRLRDRFGRQVSSDEVIRFVWSGLNSEHERNEAAVALLGIVSRLHRAGRPVHIIAHSHGGNVARRMLELAGSRFNQRVAAPATLTCVGTPFFHYNASVTIAHVLYSAIQCTVCIGLFFVIPRMDWPPQLLTACVITLHAAMMIFIFRFAVSVSQVRLARNRNLRRLVERTSIVNVYSTRDEAIYLLSSLNGTIELMRRRSSFRWLSSPLGYLTLLSIGGVASVIILLAPLAAAGLSSVRELVGALAVLGVMALIFIIISAAHRLFDNFIDRLITRRLRKAAFGDEDGAGITAVSCHPWPGTETCALPLAAEIDEAAEAYIAEHSAGAWGRLRATFAPSIPLLSQDIRRVVDDALTGDELVHTAYYRLERFADLMVTLLARSDDWVVARQAGRD